MTLPFGVKTKTSSLIEIELQVRHELRRVGCLLPPLDDAVQPREVATRRILLVVPVGRHAMLGAGVHLPGAQLHFERLALRPHHGRVQRLVEVELGIAM